MICCAVTAYSQGVPRLGCIYYGQVRNSFGRPCTESDGVTLTINRLGTNTVTWYDVSGKLGPGVNYQLQINAVSSGEAVESGTAVEGESVNLAATVGGVATHVIGNTNLLVASGGVCLRQDFILGADADGDGLPDEWEQFMLAAIGPASGMTNITQIAPQDDYDGDGASNMKEFLAGTFAFLASDALRIEQWIRSTNGTHEIKFYSTAGFSYDIRTSTNLLSGSWNVMPVSTTPSTAPAAETVDGVGDYQSVYFATNGLRNFFRIFAR